MISRRPGVEEETRRAVEAAAGEGVAKEAANVDDLDIKESRRRRK